MNIVKKCGIVALKSALIFFVSAIIAVFFMFLAFLLPTSKMMNNAKSSSEILSSEGNYKYMIPGDASTRLDNFTDSIMISEAIYESEESAIYRAMKNYFGGWGVEGLADHVNGESQQVEYSRYWNGYLIFLKPLLLVFNIKGIRILNIVLQSILVLGVCAVMLKKAKQLIIPYLLSLFVINPIAVTQSMQFSSVFYIFNIAMLLLLLFYEKLKNKNNLGYFFLIVGIVTSFFDFLTYPVASLVMPLVLVMWFDDSKEFKNKFFTAFKLGVFWAAGYFGFWIAKWCVGSIIMGENLVTASLGQVKYRTVGDVSYESNKLLIRLPFILNTNPLINLRNIIAISVCAILFVTLLIVFRKKYKIKIKTLLSFTIIALLPVLWYLVLSNHSFVHYWFTFRSYIGTIFALTTLLACGFKDLKNKKEVSDEKEDSGSIAVL